MLKIVNTELLIVSTEINIHVCCPLYILQVELLIIYYTYACLHFAKKLSKWPICFYYSLTHETYRMSILPGLSSLLWPLSPLLGYRLCSGSLKCILSGHIVLHYCHVYSSRSTHLFPRYVFSRCCQSQFDLPVVSVKPFTVFIDETTLHPFQNGCTYCSLLPLLLLVMQ